MYKRPSYGRVEAHFFQRRNICSMGEGSEILPINEETGCTGKDEVKAEDEYEFVVSGSREEWSAGAR